MHDDFQATHRSSTKKHEFQRAGSSAHRERAAQVEIEFERQARSNIQVIDYLGEYLRASGGKRVRPALTILVELRRRRRWCSLQLDPHGDGDGVSAHGDAGP